MWNTAIPLPESPCCKRPFHTCSSLLPGYFYLGLGLAKLNRDQEAVPWLEKSLANEPSDFIKQGAYFQLARLYQRLHRPEDAQRALASLKQLKAQTPNQPAGNPPSSAGSEVPSGKPQL